MTDQLSRIVSLPCRGSLPVASVPTDPLDHEIAASCRWTVTSGLADLVIASQSHQTKAPRFGGENRREGVPGVSPVREEVYMRGGDCPFAFSHLVDLMSAVVGFTPDACASTAWTMLDNCHGKLALGLRPCHVFDGILPANARTSSMWLFYLFGVMRIASSRTASRSQKSTIGCDRNPLGITFARNTR